MVKIIGIALQEHRDDASLFGLKARQLRTSEILIEEEFESKEEAIAALHVAVALNFTDEKLDAALDRIDRIGALTIGKVTVRINS